MSGKRFLIVDEDEVVLSLIKRSVLGIDPECYLISLNNSKAAVQQATEQTFDVVIADLYLLADDENPLVDTLRASQPAMPTIIATSYGYNGDGTDLNNLPIFRLLTKPIELNTLRQAVAEATQAHGAGSLPPSYNPIDQFAKAKVMIEQLRADTTARCILLCDIVGNVAIQAGEINDLPVEAITSLLSGGIATLLEAGQSIDQNDVINLAYREGRQADLYAINIRRDWILILVIDRGDTYQRLGSVWYYARKTTLALGEELEKVRPGALNSNGETSADPSYDDEVDKLFRSH
jgi:CheY-like chemotaxis protein